MFSIQNMRIVNAYELASRRMFLLTKGKWARIMFNVWREVAFEGERTTFSASKTRQMTTCFMMFACKRRHLGIECARSLSRDFNKLKQ